MKPIIKTIIITAALFLVLSGCAMIEFSKETFHSTLDSSVIKNLKVINTSGNIVVTNWDSNYIEYTITKKAVFEGDLKYVDIEVNEGSTFKLETKYPPYLCNVSVDYDIKIPKTLNVLIDNTSGNISVDGGLNAMDITATSGNVDVQNSQFIGKIKVTSGNIKVSINDLTGDAYIEATSGNIDANIKENIYKKIKSSVTSGNISFHNISDTGSGTFSVDIKTTSGNINVYNK